MSKSWLQPLSRRAPGSSLQTRLRRTTPYPTNEERAEELRNALDRYEELEQAQTHSTLSVNYDGCTSQEKAKVAVPSVKPESTPADKRKVLYQKFYRQVQEERKPADCVVLSVTNEGPEYSKSIGQCLQERGLSVDMLYLHADSGLTRALQDVRADGSPLCILVEQTNIALSSCTVIIFAQSLKIHRNMPKEQALDFVVAEYGRCHVKERTPRDPAEIAAETSQMLDDFLDREKRMRHYVSSEVRQLLLLLSEGVHLYSEELETISEYVLSRQESAQAGKTDGEKSNVLPAGLGKPPPLLPTPSPSQLLSAHSPSSLSLLGSFPKNNPPPLMSMPPAKLSLGTPSAHSSFTLPLASRAPLLETPLYPPILLRSQRFPPPFLKSSRPALLLRPGGALLPRPSGALP